MQMRCLVWLSSTSNDDCPTYGCVTGCVCVCVWNNSTRGSVPLLSPPTAACVAAAVSVCGTQISWKGSSLLNSNFRHFVGGEKRGKYLGSVFETEARSAGNNQARADRDVNRGSEARSTEGMNISSSF